jgi:hypothetical protein
VPFGRVAGLGRFVVTDGCYGASAPRGIGPAGMMRSLPDHDETCSVFPTEINGFSESVVQRLRDLLQGGLVGTYLVGSAALGGYVHGRSDIDVVAVASTALTTSEKQAIVEKLSHPRLECPTRGLEFVLYDWQMSRRRGRTRRSRSISTPDLEWNFVSRSTLLLIRATNSSSIARSPASTVSDCAVPGRNGFLAHCRDSGSSKRSQSRSCGTEPMTSWGITASSTRLPRVEVRHRGRLVVEDWCRRVGEGARAGDGTTSRLLSRASGGTQRSGTRSHSRGAVCKFCPAERRSSDRAIRGLTTCCASTNV